MKNVIRRFLLIAWIVVFIGLIGFTVFQIYLIDNQVYTEYLFLDRDQIGLCVIVVVAMSVGFPYRILYW